MKASAITPTFGRLLCALLYVAAFAVLASVLPRHFGFPLDDSWIHQVLARNFAVTGRLGFLPGHVTSGSTSLLWSALLTLYWKALPAVSPVVLSALTNALLLGAIGYTLKAITEDDALPTGASWLVALAPAASGNVLWFGMIGMEHLLFVLLSLLLVRRWLLPLDRRGRADLPVVALLYGLLTLTRPEGLCVGLLLLLTLRRAQRTVAALLAAAAGLAVALALLAGYSWRVGHRLVPQTMQGRQFLYRVSPQSGLGMRLDFLGQIVARCLKTWSFTASTNYLHHRGLLVGAPLVAVLALLLTAGLVRLYSLQARRMLMLCVWAALIVGLYTAVLPSTGHGGRYLAVPLLLFLPLEFLGLQTLLARTRATPRLVWPLVVVAALGCAVWSLGAWRAAVIAQIDQIEAEHGAMATWLQANLPEEVAHTQIGVFDIGRIGFQLRGNLVDLGGLVDPGYLRYVLGGRTAVYLAAHDVRYVVLPSAMTDDSADWRTRLWLEGRHGVALLPIHSICIDAPTDALAENSASTAYACQRAYKLMYDTSAELKP